MSKGSSTDFDEYQESKVNSEQNNNEINFSFQNHTLTKKPITRESSFDEYEYITDETKTLKVEEMAKKYEINQRSLTAKIDWNILPAFALLYFISFLNKSCFGLLFVDGIFEDLNVTKYQLAVSYASFYVPIILLQFYANYILTLVRPHFFVSLTVLCYGVFNLGCGFSKNFATFVVCQFFHGLFQSGTETTVVYILSNYYDRKQAQKRFSFLYSIYCLSGMVINLISFGVNIHMVNYKGLGAWRWLLIIVGILTMVSAIALFFLIPDFPEGARFLNDDENIFVIKKLELYNGKSGYNYETNQQDITKNLVDPLIYLPAIAAFGIGYVCHAYSIFEPMIFQTLRFDLYDTNKNSSYPWILAFGFINITSFLSDKFQNRYFLLAVNCIITIIGALLIYCDPKEGRSHLKYGGNFLMVTGSFASMPFLICWSSLNVCSHLRKSIITSLQISSYDLGGLIVIFVFSKSTSPILGEVFIAGFCFMIVSYLISSIYLVLLIKLNKEKRTIKYKEMYDSLTEKSKVFMGDKNPNFDYMY